MMKVDNSKQIKNKMKRIISISIIIKWTRRMKNLTVTIMILKIQSINQQKTSKNTLKIKKTIITTTTTTIIITTMIKREK